jgi:large subunit ribosomal protein L30
MTTTKTATVTIRQVRSAIGYHRSQREVLRGLGLRRIRHVVERIDTPAVRGMIAKIAHLVEVVDPAAGPAAGAKPAPRSGVRAARAKTRAATGANEESRS